jgi:hypothetical protein
MKIIKFVILIILLIIIQTLTSADNNYFNATFSPGNSVIKILVFNPVDSMPITGAEVVVRGTKIFHCGFTDKHGTYHCIMNYDGNVSICASYNGKF